MIPGAELDRRCIITYHRYIRGSRSAPQRTRGNGSFCLRKARGAISPRIVPAYYQQSGHGVCGCLFSATEHRNELLVG